ncbi:MAG TPA: hypothetical protein VIL18_04540 [Longimicrobiales bacterium]
MHVNRDDFRQTWVAIVVLAGLSLAGCSEALGPEEEKRAAEAAVTRWIQQHPDGWTLDLVSTKPLTRPASSQPCSQTPASGSTVLRHSARNVEIDFFKCPLPAQPSPEELSAAFSHVVLQRLPHGIRSPGWTFDVLTPSSAVEEGVTFETPAPSQLWITIRTPLYAIYGHSTRASCEPPADAPYSEECDLQAEHRVPLTVSITVPAFR